MAWLGDDSGDIDDDETRLAMLAQLEEEASDQPSAKGTHEPSQDAGLAVPAPVVEAPSSAECASPHGHSYHWGPPFLRCSVPLGMVFLQEIDPDHSLLRANKASLEKFAHDGELSVWVDWGNLDVDSTVYRLCLRRLGVEQSSQTGTAGSPLQLTFFVGDCVAVGESFVAELRWPGGSRHLHVVVPPEKDGIRYDGLVAPPGMATPVPAEQLLAPPRNKLLPLLADRKTLPSRGFGVEFEYVTEAPDPERNGCFTKVEELHAVIEKLQKELLEVDSSNEAIESRVAAGKLLDRCRQWTFEIDKHINFSPELIARKTVHVEAALSPDPRFVSEPQRCEAVLCGGPGIMKSEFQSPPPPSELNFATGAAAEIACFWQILRYMGGGCSSFAKTGQGGVSVHVHVNVLNPKSKGHVLSYRQVLVVFFNWVRFDLVIARFTRPWMWREPASPTMYATGAEYAWNECLWEQGTKPDVGSSKSDIPSFLSAVHSIIHEQSFENMSEADKLQTLFGREGTPTARMGRYCSMNLKSLMKYGTVEVRRFHGTLDVEVIQRWAHFCVCFVESFHSVCTTEILDQPLEDALAWLQQEQERATPEELMNLMAEHVDPSTAAFFMQDAVGPAPKSCP